MLTPNARRRTASVALAAAATAAVLTVTVSGCRSPEDGRPRGGGHGGDGGNYRAGAIHVPSKIDGTKTWTARPKT